jgi:hypothetical protein
MSRFSRFVSDERGSASIEFLFVVPTIMLIFMGSFESSYFMIRHVMLDRSVDIVVRDIRLGILDGITHDQLKTAICNEAVLISSTADCVRAMRIWMQPISTANFDMLAPPRFCGDVRQNIAPLQDPTGAEFRFGTDNEIMLMRICLKDEPMFPTTALTAAMIRDEADGAYAMVVTSVFVNEPG